MESRRTTSSFNSSNERELVRGAHVVSQSAPNPLPADSLREVPILLREQWTKFIASRTPILRWVVAHDEGEWVETFLESRMDEASKAFVVDRAFDRPDAYGFGVSSALREPLVKTRFAGRGVWAPPTLPRGARDVEALAATLASFARHSQSTWLRTIGIVFAPATVRDPSAWLQWIETFVTALVRFAPNVRVVVLEDPARPVYEALARRHPHAVSTVRADLGIAARTARMVESAADLTTTAGRIRALNVRAVLCVNAGRVDEAEAMARDIERLASSAGVHGAAVPVRFAVAGGLTAAGRHLDAVASYRAAEASAARAEASGEPNAARLRITTRFGVAAGILAVPQGAVHAARYYEETAPMCARLGDTRLELECHRCAGSAFELARMLPPAWDACVRALGLVDRLSASEREATMLVPLADAMLRLTTTAELRRFRQGIEVELRRRRMHGTATA
jgi:hypothetical protein